MGRGLDIKTTGTHIAFAAGTGILVFIDIIAHLILRIIGKNGGPDFFQGQPEDAVIDIDNFKLILHTSFASEAEAIGLDLIETLANLCSSGKYSNLFEHKSRIAVDLGND